MASMLNMLNDSAIASPMMIRADLYHKLALGNDTMGVDRNSIENDLWVNIVDVVILAFTIIGAGSILISMLSREIRGRAATVRTRLVQGLVVSDLTLGLVAIISSSRKLQGKGFETGTQACDGFGLLLVATLWTEHFWTFSLAFATYMILIYPLSRVTRILERRWPFLYLIIWTTAFGLAVLTYELYGYWASGGLCYYGSNSGLYGELMQFMPRALVFIAICFFYARLYVFLRRPDRIKASFSNSGRRDTAAQRSDPEYTYQSATSSMLAERAARRHETTTPKEKIASQFAKFSFKKRSAAGLGDADEKKVDKQDPSRSIRERDYAGQPGSAPEQGPTYRSEKAEPQVTEIPPWEKLELPAFQIDGQRYGGQSSSAGTQSSSAWGDLKPFGKKNGGAKRPTSAGSTRSAHKTLVQKAYPRDRTRSPQVAPIADQTSSIGGVSLGSATPSRQRSGDPPFALFGTYEGMAPKTIVTAPSPQIDMDSFPIPSPIVEEDTTTSMVFKHPRPHPGALDIAPDQQAADAPQRDERIGDPLRASTGASCIDVLTPSTTASSSRPLIDRAPQPSFEHSHLASIRRESMQGGFGDNESRRGSGPVSFVLPPSHREEGNDTGSERAFGSVSVPDYSSSRTTDGDEEAGPPNTKGTDGGGSNDDDDDDDLDFAQMLAASYTENPTAGRQGRTGSEDTEFIQESTASYLNRKTAMLMLYFPLAYCVLFSVSLIRIIFDLTSDGAPKPLRVIARWFVFSQGAVDAVIYGIVEVNVKRGVRKKVKKGLISPGASRGSRGSWADAGTGSANVLNGFLGKKRGTSQGAQVDPVDALRSST